ncbi:MAG TPA: hypothetical protein VKF80_01830 [Candidatus Eisenbacteria bacterium]|nr:hypothetical protein [Candidatus Eisenbacteria bacterium]
METPPLESLQKVFDRLAAAGVTCALGGSGLLASLGLVDHVRDWDLTAEGDVAAIAALFADLPQELAGNSGIHADHKVMLPGESTEVIVNFAFAVEGPVLRIPTLARGTWHGVATASPECWAVAYWLMGEYEGVPQRRERAELLFSYVEENGPDAEALQQLLAQPLPESLTRRLIALQATSLPPDGSDAPADEAPA